MVKQHIHLAGLLALGLIQSCGSNAPIATSSVEQHPPVIGQPAQSPGPVPGLPEVSALAAEPAKMAACDFTNIYVQGDSFYEHSAGAAPDAESHTLSLPAPAGGVEWVVYGLAGLTPESIPSKLEVQLDVEASQTLYVALADYSTERWVWQSFEIDGFNDPSPLLQFDFTNPPDYISPASRMFFAVAVWDGKQASVRSAQLSFGQHDIWVTDITASDGSSIDTVNITWTAVPDAIGYELYYRRVNLPGTLYLLAEPVDPAYSHTILEPVGKEAIPGMQYIYFVAAEFSDGYCSRLSGWDTGYCGTIP